jgi:hydrogenase maturation protease
VRVLIAGIGNVFRGDDGFGVEVARRLATRGVPAGVDVVDFGIRGFDLALALSSGANEAAILVDAAARGGAPGTIYVLAPGETADFGGVETHGMHPLRALELARALGGLPSFVRVVACEPASLGDEEVPEMRLSPEVASAVEVAITVVDGLLHEVGDA